MISKYRSANKVDYVSARAALKPKKKHTRTEKSGDCGKDDTIQEAGKMEVPPLGSGVNFPALVKRPSTTLDALTQQARGGNIDYAPIFLDGTHMF